ncbi:MAG: hypothetical protein GEU96_12320 [Propionibacteriales bacterium]|nr:hypothetical protein [Propionibacteriales bacterium]
MITIAPRFAGPPRSANGGYTAGLLAATIHAGGDAPRTSTRDTTTGVSVSLRQPPPLGIELDVDGGPTTARLMHGAVLVAEASVVDVDITPVDAVSMAEAAEAERSYAGLRSHPFPTCFTCGPDREPGDGLRLFSGPVGDGRTACLWTPHASLERDPGVVGEEYVWAALDCPGAWTVDLEGRPLVLGRMTAQLDAPATIGERHVVMGRLLGEDGRKTFTATTLYDSDGRIVARAEHLWIAIDPTTFGALSA